MRQQIRYVVGGLAWAALSLSAALADEHKADVTPEAAAIDPDFAVQGEYVAPQLGVQVVARGQGQFLIVTYQGGLPGAGWNGTEKQELEEDAAFVGDLIQDRRLKKI